MLRRDDGVACAAILDQLRPVFGIIIGGGEFIGLFHVILKRDVAVVESPALGCASGRVRPPVDKNTEFRFRKPVHALGLLLRGFPSTLDAATVAPPIVARTAAVIIVLRFTCNQNF